MAALINPRNTTEIANGARALVLPVKAGTEIYQGALVAIEGGYAIPAKTAINIIAVGRAQENADNTKGANGDIYINVLRGVFVFENTSTADNKVTPAHLMTPCYMEDDQTVTALATGTSIAGLVVRVDDDGVAVEICPALMFPKETTV